MRLTPPMLRVLGSIVRNETFGARNQYTYHVLTLQALVRRNLIFFQGSYVLPTADGIKAVES